MNYKFKIEFVFSLLPNEPDNLDVLSYEKSLGSCLVQLSFWLFIKKDYTWTYKENNFPDLNYYNQFYYQGALVFFLTYDLHFKQTNLSFFKKNSSFLDVSIY